MLCKRIPCSSARLICPVPAFSFFFLHLCGCRCRIYMNHSIQAYFTVAHFFPLYLQDIFVTFVWAYYSKNDAIIYNKPSKPIKFIFNLFYLNSITFIHDSFLFFFLPYNCFRKIDHTLWKDTTITKPALLIFASPTWSTSVLPNTDKRSRAGGRIQGHSQLISTHLAHFSSSLCSLKSK